MNLASLREKAQAFLQDIQEEIYQQAAGLKSRLDISAVHSKYPDLFDRASLDLALEERAKAAGEERQQLDYLCFFLANGHLARRVSRITDEIATREADATVDWQGRAVPFRYLTVMLAQEPDRARRRALALARDRVLSELNPLRAERFARWGDSVRELGYDNYPLLVDELKGTHHVALGGLVEALVAATHAGFSSALERMLSHMMDLHLDKACAHDIPHLVRSVSFDSYFPADQALGCLHRTLEHMGIRLGEQQNIILDVTARDRKKNGAFAVPVRIPDRIYLVVQPIGGQDDYQALLHEAGHAEHWSHTDPAQPFEFRCLGDDAIGETFAFLFEHLAMNARWIGCHLTHDRLEDYIRFSRLVRLYKIRRYAARFSYALEAYAMADPARLRDRYLSRFRENLIVEPSAEMYLKDLDDQLYASAYLRAWIFEPQLRAHMRDKVGENWFETAEGGGRLRELWRWGQCYNVEQLARQLSQGGLDVDALRKELLAD